EKPGGRLGVWSHPLAHSGEAPRTCQPSWVLRSNDLLQILLLLRRQIVAFILGECEKHQQPIRRWMGKIDDPNAAPLASSRAAPAELWQAAGPWDDRSGRALADEMTLECSVRLVIQQI